MIFCFAFFVRFSSMAQESATENLRQRLLKINSVNEARKLLLDDKIVGDILTVDSSSDSSGFTKYWLEKEVGEILISHANQDTTYLFKLVSVDSVPVFRVQYIYLDGAKLNSRQIEETRAMIYKRISQGDKFETLANQYSMDGNSKKGGDLGWFEEGQMMQEFQDAISRHQLGEVFSVDIPSQRWYYIVRNTHRPKHKKTSTVVYVLHPNN